MANRHICNNSPTSDAHQYPISYCLEEAQVGHTLDKKGVSQGRFGLGKIWEFGLGKEFHKCNFRISCVTSGFFIQGGGGGGGGGKGD